MAKILLVEDNDTNREAMSRVLERDGNNVDGVFSGELALLNVVEKQQIYDVILMDLGLPGIDGIETSRRLRGSGFLGPIIVLTAQPDSVDRCQAKEAGCNEYAAKPVRSKDLKDFVKRFFN